MTTTFNELIEIIKELLDLRGKALEMGAFGVSICIASTVNDITNIQTYSVDSAIEIARACLIYHQDKIKSVSNGGTVLCENQSLFLYLISQMLDRRVIALERGGFSIIFCMFYESVINCWTLSYANITMENGVGCEDLEYFCKNANIINEYAVQLYDLYNSKCNRWWELRSSLCKDLYYKIYYVTFLVGLIDKPTLFIEALNNISINVLYK